MKLYIFKDGIPKVNYRNHYYYKERSNALSLYERIYYKFKSYPKLFKTIIHYLPIFIKSLPHLPRYNLIKDTDSFFSDGYKAVSLDDEIIREIYDASQKTIDQVEAHKRNINKDKMRFDDCVHRVTDERLYKVVKKHISNHKSLNSILSKLLEDPEYNIPTMNLHINTPDDYNIFSHSETYRSKNPAYAYHVDTTINSIKMMIYLNDVDDHGGPFHYIPGTHLKNTSYLNKFVRKINRVCSWALRDDENIKLFNSLPRWFQQKNDFGTDVYDKDTIEFISLNEVVLTSVFGNCILFDPNGIHRGGIVEKGKRIAIQVVFANRKQKIVF